jgi:hypothetical protein
VERWASVGFDADSNLARRWHWAHGHLGTGALCCVALGLGPVTSGRAVLFWWVSLFNLFSNYIKIFQWNSNIQT